MGGIVTYDMPTMATLTLEFTALPLALSLWFYSPSLMSWAVATSLILVWEIGVRFGFNVDDVFGTFVSTAEYDDARTALGALVILCFVYSMVGAFIAWILDIANVLPYYALFASSPDNIASSMRRKVGKAASKIKGSKSASSIDDDEKMGEKKVKPTGLNRGDLINLPRPYLHCFVTTIFFLISVMASHVAYSLLMDDTGSHNAIALSLACILPLISNICLVVFWYLKPDPLVWGLHKNNVDDVVGATEEQADEATPTANKKIVITFFVLTIAHLMVNVTLGIVRIVDLRTNSSLIGASVLIAVMFVLTLIAYLVIYWLYIKSDEKKALKNKKANNNDDDDGQEEEADDNVALMTDEASVPVNVQNRFNSMQQTQRLGRTFK